MCYPKLYTTKMAQYSEASKVEQLIAAAQRIVILQADNPDGDNYFRWVNPNAAADIEKAGGTFDQSVRREAYCDLGKLIQEDAVQDYMFLWQDGYGFSTDLTGYVVSTWGSMTWDIQNWKYK